MFYMFGPDSFEDWVTPAVVRLCFSSLRLSRVSPRSQPFERVTALFSGFVPGGIRYCSWVFGYLRSLVISGDECIQIRALVFYEPSDLNIGEVISSRTFPYCESLF